MPQQWWLLFDETNNDLLAAQDEIEEDDGYFEEKFFDKMVIQYKRLRDHIQLNMLEFERKSKLTPLSGAATEEVQQPIVQQTVILDNSPTTSAHVSKATNASA